MTEETILLIQENCKLVDKQCNKILELKSCYEIATSPDHPFYSVFSTETEREKDLAVIERKIVREETILQGLLK